MKFANSDEPAGRPWEPLKRVDGARWENCYYTVTYRRDRAHKMRWIMIVNADQSASRDWREFQQIKNEILGPEVEAVELYPAESRLQDPSNAFFLWAPDAGFKRLGIYAPRTALGPDESLAPQRSLTRTDRSP